MGNSTVNCILAIGSQYALWVWLHSCKLLLLLMDTLSLIYPLDSVSMSIGRGNSSKIGVMS